MNAAVIIRGVGVIIFKVTVIIIRAVFFVITYAAIIVSVERNSSGIIYCIERIRNIKLPYFDRYA